MTKVLHIYKTYYPDTIGGIENFIFNLTAETEKLGMKNSILTVSKNQHTQNHEHGIPVIRQEANFEIASCPFSFSMAKNFKKIIAPFDVLHLHFPWPFGEFVTTYLAKTDKKIIATYHSDIVKQKYLKKIYQPLMNRFFARCDRIVVSSPNLLSSSPDLKNYQTKCSMIELGITHSSITNEQKINFWRNQLGDNFLLFIGQFRYYKGLKVLLNALQNTNIKTVLVGSGPLESELKQLAQNLKLNHVYFLGSLNQEDKSALLHLCKALVLPSIHRSEAFGIVLLEAASYKKPLISTELGTGTSYINLNQKTGFVVPPNDPKRLRDAIEKLFSDKELANNMGINAHQRFQEKFTIEKIATKYRDLYRENKLR